MVRGLVEEEEVGLLREDDAELKAPALSPRERFDRPLEIAIGEAELVREHCDLALELVAAREVIAVLNVRQVIERACVAARRVVERLRELVAERHHVAKPREERAEHVPLGLQLVRLAVVAEGGLLLDDRRPRVGLRFFGNQAKKRRLSCAVGGHESRTLAEGEGERHVLEESLARIPEAEIGNLKHGHRAGAT